jgi:hypothetical protein
MPIETRTFRVFVSSTFDDLEEERNQLLEVFDKLRIFCEQYGAQFQAIDLRWGVSDEAGLDQRTMEICLGEIRRCRATGIKPNFIVLLGSSYGWRPLPSRIAADEFEELRFHCSPGDRAILKRWYVLDENAVPPEFRLQPRTGRFADPREWTRLEDQLREMLARAAKLAGCSEEKRLKYEASAVHQETYAGLSGDHDDRRHVFGFFRRSAESGDPRVEQLKARLWESLPGNITEFDRGDLKTLRRSVYKRIRRVILAELKRLGERTDFDLEIAAHDSFAIQRSARFQGRETALHVVEEYLADSDVRPLVVLGPSGSGKSAVLAKVSLEYGGPARVLRRFIGISPQSTNGYALIASLCRQISLREVPLDYAGLEVAFQDCLRCATATEPLMIFIDALDQLLPGDPARRFAWLPAVLPPHVKVVVSITDDAGLNPHGATYRLETMSEEDGAAALDAWLENAKRTLQPWQRETVLAHFAPSGLPLYLKMAAEEARLWTSYDSPERCSLGDGVGGITDTLFRRLAAKSNHGPEFVERSLGYLAAARYGLAETEMLDILTQDDIVWEHLVQQGHHRPSRRRLPVAIWSRFLLDLEPYLMQREATGEPLIAFYHQQFVERATRLRASPDAHDTLAQYFRRVADPAQDGSWSGRSRHAFDELSFQVGHAGASGVRGPSASAALEALMLDPLYCAARIGVSTPFDLLADCREVLLLGARSRIAALERVLSSTLQALCDRPALALQTLVNRLAWLDPATYAEARVARAIERLDNLGWWLQSESPYPASGMSSLSVPFGCDVVNLRLTPDERQLVSIDESNHVRTYDLERGMMCASYELSVAQRVRSFCASDLENVVAWQDEAGAIRFAQDAETTLAGARDGKLVFLRELGVIAVNATRQLVAWNYVQGEVDVLTQGVAEPVAVLRASSGGQLLCISGTGRQRILLVSATARTVTLDVPWDGERIVDADVDASGQLLVTLCADRSLSLVSAFDGHVISSVAYERSAPSKIFGPPLRCAMKSAGDAIWAFFATRNSHVGAWSPDSAGLVRLEDYELSAILEFRCLKSGELLLGLEQQARLLTERSVHSRESRHRGPVLRCAIADSGTVVSISRDETICAYSNEVGMKLVSEEAHARAACVGTLPHMDEILVGDREGNCSRRVIGATERGDVWHISDNELVDVFCVEPQTFVASAANGWVFRWGPLSETADTVPPEGNVLRQTAIRDGGGKSLWELQVRSEKGDSVYALVKVDRFGRARTVVHETARIPDFDVAPGDRDVICVAGLHSRIIRVPTTGAVTVQELCATTDFVRFLGPRLVVAMKADSGWLQVYRVSGDPPQLVAEVDLPETATCIATRNDRVVIGFVSGRLMRFRVRPASPSTIAPRN